MLIIKNNLLNTHTHDTLRTTSLTVCY